MSTSSHAAPVITPDMDADDALEATVRAELGLRPTRYNSLPKTGDHPDQRPCPPWCDVAQSDDEDDVHEVDGRHPLVADHSMEVRLAIVASRYERPRMPGADLDVVTTATIEPYLRQHGQAEPEIDLRAEEVRGDEGLPRVGFAEVLRLGLTDAEELATMLQYLVRQAESA